MMTFTWTARVVAFLLSLTFSSSHNIQQLRSLAQVDSAATNDASIDSIARCGNAHSTDHDHRSQLQALRSYNAKQQWLVDGENIEAATAATTNSFITIPVCFHLAIDDYNYLSDQQLQNQLDALNKAYSAESCCDQSLLWCEPGMCSIETGFRFEWAVLDEENDQGGGLVDGVTVPTLADHPNACVLRQEGSSASFATSLGRIFSRRGDASVLNVYWADMRHVLGFATNPWFYRFLAPTDGVTVNYKTINGSTRSFIYNEGDTLVHEVAHWLGLLHTFAGGCSNSDGIHDTPPEAKPHLGDCGFSLQSGPDTCPGDEGLDPITNFLGYAHDSCMFQFTPGQVRMMHACYDTYRLGNKRQTERSAEIPLISGEPSSGHFIGPEEALIFSLETTASSVTCNVTVTEGTPSLAMAWGQPPTTTLPFLNACSNDWVIFRWENTCTARLRLWRTRLYASVRAPFGRAVQDMNIVCTEN